MTFQTTFDLEVFIKSCNALRLSVCSDGEATLDKWIALAKKKSVDGKITFTKQIVKDMDRYADTIAGTGVRYVYGEDDEFSPDLQLCLWALDPNYRVGAALTIGLEIDTLKWIEKHYNERLDSELIKAISCEKYERRLNYLNAFPTNVALLERVLTVDQVIENVAFDATALDCVESLYDAVERFGHKRTDNKVVTLIYQNLDTLLNNKVSLNTLVSAKAGRETLSTIFKSPKAYKLYWERFATCGLNTENRDGVKTVVGYCKWFIDMSIDVRGFLDVLNDMWDIYLPTQPDGARILSKHYEIEGQLPLEDKVYFTNLPLSAIQSLYPDFKVTSFQDFINGEPVNEPIVITYPERRTMAHVLLKEKHDKMATPAHVNHPVIYIGWPVEFTRKHLNIVEYDGALEVVEREAISRFSLLRNDVEVPLGDMYLNRTDKPYRLDVVVKEELGNSANNMSALLKQVEDNVLTLQPSSVSGEYDSYIGAVVSSMSNSRMIGHYFNDTHHLSERDFDGDVIKYTHKDSTPLTLPEFELTPSPVQYPMVVRNPICDIKNNERYRLCMGEPVNMGRHYAETIGRLSPLDFGDRLYMPLISTPRMEHIASAARSMAETMNKMFTDTGV